MKVIGIIIALVATAAGWFFGKVPSAEKGAAPPSEAKADQVVAVPTAVDPIRQFERGVEKLAESDPLAAFTKANANREMSSDDRKYLLSSVVLSWCSKRSPAEAWDFLLQDHDPPLPEEHLIYLRKRVLSRYLVDDISGSINAVTRHDPFFFGGKNEADDIADKLAKYAPLKALEWLRVSAEEDPSYDRSSLVYSVLREIVDRYPAEVTAILAEGVPGDERTRENGRSDIFQGWYRTDPEAAIAWLMKNEPPGKARTRIFESTAMRFRNERDIEGAFAFLESPGITDEESAAVLSRIANLATKDLPRYLEAALDLQGYKSDAYSQ